MNRNNSWKTLTKHPIFSWCLCIDTSSPQLQSTANRILCTYVHCYRQHDSIDPSGPADQSDTICFQCHQVIQQAQQDLIGCTYLIIQSICFNWLCKISFSSPTPYFFTGQEGKQMETGARVMKESGLILKGSRFTGVLQLIQYNNTSSPAHNKEYTFILWYIAHI